MAVAANLAVALAKKGARVGLIDADIYGPSQHIMFRVENEQLYVNERDGKQFMIPVDKYGVKMLSIGLMVDPNQPIPWRGPMASKALKQLFSDAEWGELDYLLIDLPPGTGDIHLTLVSAVPVTGSVIVSTPQHVALADARKGIGMFRLDTINVPVLGLIENMAYFTPEELPNNKYYIFGKEGARDLAHHRRVPDRNVLKHEAAERISMNDIAKVTFKLAQPLFVDPYDANRATGAFIVIDESTNNTIGAGMIL